MYTNPRTLYELEEVYIDPYAPKDDQLRGRPIETFYTLPDAKKYAKKEKLKAYRITRTDTVYTSTRAGEIIDDFMAGRRVTEAA